MSNSDSQRRGENARAKQTIARLAERPAKRPPPQPNILNRNLDLDLDDASGPSRPRSATRPVAPRPTQVSAARFDGRDLLSERQRTGPVEATAPVVPPLVQSAEERAELEAVYAGEDFWYDIGGVQIGPRHRSLLLGAIALMSLAIIYLLLFPKDSSISDWLGMDAHETVAARPPAAATPGEHSLLLNGGEPTITARQVEQILGGYNSPALKAGGQVWVDLGRKYGIDPAYAVAFFIHESTAGTHPNWAGLKPDGSSTYNVGNIICAGYATCYKGFRDYPNWEAGIEDWYRLIAREYVDGRGVTTLEQIIPIYAPSFENDVPAYVNTVSNLVATWRSGAIR